MNAQENGYCRSRTAPELLSVYRRTLPRRHPRLLSRLYNTITAPTSPPTTPTAPLTPHCCTNEPARGPAAEAARFLVETAVPVAASWVYVLKSAVSERAGK